MNGIGITYATADFPLIVTLSLWFPIENIDRSDPRRAHFVFRRTKKLEDLLADYQQRKILVEPSAFYGAMKQVKSRLYDGV